MKAQIQPDKKHILEKFHSDEIIKYLLSQITRVYELSTPYITVNLVTLEIEHHINVNDKSLSYWKEQLNNYIRVYYPEIAASLDKNNED
jgi:hypothetical protein